MMKRRSFGKLLAAAGVTASIKNGWARPLMKTSSAPQLPEVTSNENSVEICLNSRRSEHSGYSSNLNDQVAANCLWAAASAPLVATERFIYVALPDGVFRYRYVDGNHQLEEVKTGDHRTENATAFEIGISTDPSDAVEDAGIALHWAQLASVAFWQGTTNQPVCCPKDSATFDADWNPVSSLHLVNCYGSMSSIAGITGSVVAKSSDGSLPDPVTDGTVTLEEAIQNPLFGDAFSSEDLTTEQVSQILWASYGCTDHSIFGGKGVTVASWMAEFFMTNRIYVASAAGVHKYHSRSSYSDFNSQEHRLEPLSENDSRSGLRSAMSRLPQQAPVYIVFCGIEDNRENRIEAGYCGSSALLQTTAMGLQGHYCAQLNSSERSDIRQSCGISSDEVPLLVFSAGNPENTRLRHGRSGTRGKSVALKANPNPFTGKTTIAIRHSTAETIDAAIFSADGRCIRSFNRLQPTSRPQNIVWDGRNNSGHAVPSGVYTCRIRYGEKMKSLSLYKV